MKIWDEDFKDKPVITPLEIAVIATAFIIVGLVGVGLI